MRFISYPFEQCLQNSIKLFIRLLSFFQVPSLRNSLLGLGSILIVPVVYAAPVWTFTPITPTSVTLPVDGVVSVKYQVTNQSNRPHTLMMTAIPGVTQIITSGNCGKRFRLGAMGSCTLNLKIRWNALQGNITSGPIVCDRGNALECYGPSQPLNIIKGAVPRIILTVTPSSITFPTDGQGSVFVKNSATSTQPAKNVKASIPSSSNIKIQGNTCGTSLAIGRTCRITFAADEIEQATNIFIKGTNSNQVRVKATVTSAAKYQVGGNVSGLDDNQTLTLQNNGGDNLTVTGDGPFVFSKPLDKGAQFSVTILVQPSSQNCSVKSASGVAGGRAQIRYA